MKKKPFRPAWWLRSPHAQTLWASTCRLKPKIATRRERIELPDGDFIDLNWSRGNESAPLAVILHGLEGSLDSGYVRGIMTALKKSGWQAVVMHFRGCSDEPNRLPRAYHSGDTGDIAYFVNELRQRFPNRTLAAVGYSLGGNALLKWLGESGENNPLQAAVAVSVPFDLAIAASKLKQGGSRLYQQHLLTNLKKTIECKKALLEPVIDFNSALASEDFYDFDDRVTAPLHGFQDVHDYYQRSSSKQYLTGIKIPTLIIHSSDDPFMTPAAVPNSSEVSEAVTFELCQHGGHVGFISGRLPGKANYWLENRIPAFLAKFMNKQCAK